MNDEEHRRRKYILLAVIALLIAFLAFFLAQNAQTTADNNANITNVFEIVVNNTNLAPTIEPSEPGTGERVTGVKYYTNTSPIQLLVFAHANVVAQTATVEVNINGTIVANQSGRPLGGAEETHRSVDLIVPKGATYIVNISNAHHYEWREYPILSGRNGTLSVNQTFITTGTNYNASYVPYNGATQNITVGYNKFAIISMDSNSTIQLPNSSDGSIIIAQNNSGVTGQNRCVLALDSVGSVKCSNGITLTNATIDLTTETINQKINDTTIVATNKTGVRIVGGMVSDNGSINNEGNLLCGITPTFAGWSINPGTSANMCNELTNALTTSGTLGNGALGTVIYDTGSSKRMVINLLVATSAGTYTYFYIALSDDGTNYYISTISAGAQSIQGGISTIGKGRYIKFAVLANTAPTVVTFNARAYNI